MAVRAPVQARSVRTLDAILDATEALLETRRFEQIPVAAIILKAGVSNGSFYARFSGKDALLPALYSRYNADIPERMRQLRERLAEQGSLAEACISLVASLAAFFQGRVNLMRAITLYARTRPEEIRPLIGERFGFHQQMVDLFRPYHRQIGGAQPEETVRSGLFVAVTAVREAVLFPDAPFAATSRRPLDALLAAIAAMLLAFLSRKEPAA